MKTNTKNNRSFIPLERINFITARTQFKYKRSCLKIVGAVGLMTFSFIVPDLSLGFLLGVCLLSPIKFKDSLKNKKDDLKHIINKRLVLWGVK